MDMGVHEVLLVQLDPRAGTRQRCSASQPDPAVEVMLGPGRAAAEPWHGGTGPAPAPGTAAEMGMDWRSVASSEHGGRAWTDRAVPCKQIHFFIVPCRKVPASSPKQALGPHRLQWHVSLGSYPDAGILGVGCGGAPAMPPAVPGGGGQGLQVSVVDVVILLAALLQRARKRLKQWLDKSCRNNPNFRVRLEEWFHSHSCSPTPWCGGCQDRRWVAAAHPVPPRPQRLAESHQARALLPGSLLPLGAGVRSLHPGCRCWGEGWAVRVKRSRVPRRAQHSARFPPQILAGLHGTWLHVPPRQEAEERDDVLSACLGWAQTPW